MAADVAKRGTREDAIALLHNEIERLHGEKNEAQRQEHMAKTEATELRSVIHKTMDALLDIDPGQAPTWIKCAIDDLYSYLHPYVHRPEERFERTWGRGRDRSRRRGEK